MPEEEDEDDSLIRRRGRDKKTTKQSSSTAKVQRTPKKIKAAIANYKEKKYLTASLKLFRLLESQKSRHSRITHRPATWPFRLTASGPPEGKISATGTMFEITSSPNDAQVGQTWD